MIPAGAGRFPNRDEHHSLGAMGIVVGLNGERIDPLEESICAQLRASGSARAALGSLPVPVEQWRTTARAAARRLDRPVRTLIATDLVHAVLSDWPANDREQAIHDAALRSAVMAISDHTEDTDALEPLRGHPRGVPLMLSAIGRWDIEVDLDFAYDGTFTVRGTNVDAYETADALRECFADHGMRPYAILTPERDHTGQFVADRVHVHLIGVRPGEPPDHQASSYIGEASPRTSRRLYLPMLDYLTRRTLPALPARIPLILPVGRDRIPVFALTVNRR